jgi:hypothetical protein
MEGSAMSAPASTIMSRINYMDFFSALPSGIYILISLSMPYGAFAEGKSDFYLSGILKSIDNTGKGIFLGVILIFVAYLFGIGLRAIPARTIESIINFFKILLLKNRNKFPFATILNEKYIDIKNNSISGIGNIFDNDEIAINMNVFNIWKDVLCYKNPQAFQYYQCAEARVRSFTCMFWASIIGLASSIITLEIVRPFTRTEPSIILFCLSFILCILILSGFNSLRREEAKILFSLYLAHRQDEINTEKRI